MQTSNAVQNMLPKVGREVIDMAALIKTLWRGKWWVAACALLAILVGGYYAFKGATPMYPARAVIALEAQEQSVVDIQSVLPGGAGGSEEMNTEVAVLKSRVLIGRLVSQLNLVEDPEFNTTLRTPSKFNPRAIISRLLRDPYVPTQVEIRNNVIDALQSAITVSNIRQSLVFNIDAISESPVKSALIANSLAAIYIEDTLDKKRSATERASVWLSEKAAELKDELEASELAVSKFKDETEVVSPEALEGLSRQLRDLRQRMEDIQKNKTAAEVKLTSIEAGLAANDLNLIADVTKDADLMRFARSQNAPEFTKRLAIVQAQLESNKARLTQQLTSLGRSELALRTEIESQSSDLVQLQQLAREAQANGLLFESFLTRLKETSIQKGLQQPDSRLLSEAVPRAASAPRKSVILIFSAMLGSLIGSALVLFKEFTSRSFRTSEELESYTGKLVLGSIPRVKTDRRLGVLEYAMEKPTSAFAEAVRNLRTSVLMSDVDKAPQVIMSTSSVPGEGKTTQSLMLAQNMAGLGKRVLVLEGDVRKLIFSEYFDTKTRPGFLSVLSGSATLEEAIFKHERMGVDLLFGERSAANAADVFSSERFETFLADLRTQYDYIIVDSAPVLAVPDARIIARFVDAIIYTVRWDSTTKSEVKAGLEMFSSVGLDVTGLVLSNIDVKKLQKYGADGAYGYSGYYEN